YVQEYGPDAPGPNRGAVYVAYLDSVEFFRPRPARTAVYQELVLAYLAWAARAQGRRRAYIWACPPQRGNSFIFWCHPPHQRTPSKERLLRCPPIKRDEGEGAGAGALGYACPPVFDGDFWVEQIVKIADRQQKTLRAPPATPGAACSRIAAKLLAHKEAGPFLRPVDPVALNIPDYFTVIARPMDLGTVAANLAAGQYLSVNDFVQDMALVFGNAKRYNPPGHFVHQLALKLERLFD
ncbi:unnamed protein product, partial [Heterosigma akashiwo]